MAGSVNVPRDKWVKAGRRSHNLHIFHGPGFQGRLQLLGKFQWDMFTLPDLATAESLAFRSNDRSGIATRTGQILRQAVNLLQDRRTSVLLLPENGDHAVQKLIRPTSLKKPIDLPVLDIGRPIEVKPSPKKPLIALTNHRFELIIYDIRTKKIKMLDKILGNSDNIITQLF